MVDDDPASRNLDVYDTKNGLWNPDLGELECPNGWELLASGDAFLTRRVKAGGLYWVVWRPKGRNREHRRILGLVAPAEAIAAARAAATDTAELRAKQRVSNARHRERSEADYRAEFVVAVLQWLDFTDEHQALAEAIAAGSAEQAAVVGSGRVGRTKTLSLDERAALAARAYIRHHHTAYEDELFELDPFEADIDDDDYRRIKQAAQRAVDEFLETHRRH